jgi:DNA (cytosine-5)-methyltransferase 1
MINFGSLFTGAGGFDLGFEQVGMKVAWQCEKNKQCKQILQKHWPGVPLYEDITKKNTYVPVQLICGGDPCPIRSRARSNGKSKHPDLSGYFLAVVGRLRPRWVVRENVPAPDDVHFTTALEMLGYGTVIIRINADKATGQCRQRDFIVGCYQTTGESLAEVLPFVKNGKWYSAPGLGTRQIIPCLNTKPRGDISSDCLVYDGRLRILDGEERTAFAGFPAGWFDGASEASIARMTGNAVVVLVAEFLGRMIIEADRLLMGE